ncbi:MAG: DNA recombination protein RmuC [Candidatus Zixiibacteriota bacterium]
MSDQLGAVMESLKSDILSRQFEGLVSLRKSLDDANQTMSQRLSESTTAWESRLGLFGEIENKLGELSLRAKAMEEIGSDVRSLSDQLKPPKLRGSLGELLLENMLGQILPPAMYQAQFRFSQGQRVDAIVRLGERVLPIDSKFPLESFERLRSAPDDAKAEKEFIRTVRKHIDAIAARYLLPEENTTDFALMYIPSEAVYYQFVSSSVSEALEYALSKGVIPTCPGHLYGFLASLSLVYRENNLLTNRTRLSATLRSLAEAVTSIGRQHQRMEGASRSLASSMNRLRDDLSTVRRLLDSLNDSADTIGKGVVSPVDSAEHGVSG